MQSSGRQRFLWNSPTSFNWDPSAFLWSERFATLLTAGAANGLYTLGGVVLMLWTENLSGLVRASMWATWLAGAGMTLAAVFDHVAGMMASTSVLFPLLIAWTGWFGLFRKQDSKIKHRS